VCFPSATHLDARYLRWLYADNPAGAVVGMDAWDGERLAAHYVCVPAEARWLGRDCRVLLSLNTATHPDYQGRGLFTRLAEHTYAAGAERGFDAVYGVANANSTPGFLRKLGFGLVGPLDARIGISRIEPRPPEEAQQDSVFHRRWTTDALRWRCANPARPYRVGRLSADALGVSASTGWPGLRAWAELPAAIDPTAAARVPRGLRLHLGLRPGPRRGANGAWIDIPARFRASPLNLIFRSLVDGSAPLDARAVFFGSLDFDAF
jgi:GNAT superfamily N-acetyltransferase